MVAGPFLLLFHISTGFADEAEPPESHRKLVFDLQDKNGDGAISVEEYVGGSLGRAGENKRDELRAWDLNGDGALSFAEFRMRGNLSTPQRRDPEREFKRHDRNFDGTLTLDEFAGARNDVQKAKGAFFRLDTDDDGTLSAAEFAGEGGPMSTDEQFRFRDADGDLQLSEEEFLIPVRGKGGGWEEAARAKFRRYDVDGDGSLTLREFRLTPAQNPDAETTFYARDANLDSRLSPDELTRQMGRTRARRAIATFEEYDLDGDGVMSLPEFEAREATIEARHRFRYWSDLAELWGTRALIGLDVFLVAWLVRVFRRWRNRPALQTRREPAGASHADSVHHERPQSSSARSPDGPLQTATSLDEFEIC